MGPKSEHALKMERERVFALRWQFLRRNEKYRADYDQYVRLKMRKGKNEQWLKEQHTYFDDRWGIKTPADYTLANPNPVPIISDDLFLEPAVRREDNKFSRLRGIFEKYKTKDGQEIIVRHYCNYSVNLEFPTAFILDAIQKLVREDVEKRKAALRAAKNEGVCFSLRDADKLFKVWDFYVKHREKLTQTQMSQKFYCNKEYTYASEQYDAFKKQLAKARKFVEWGYKYIKGVSK